MDHPRDLCECGHLRSAHRDFGGCLVAMVMTRDRGLQNMSKAAEGSWRTPQSSICPCAAFRPTGERWEPPLTEDDADLAA